jgi:hypothetical protein
MDAKRSGVLFRKKQCAAKYFTQAGLLVLAVHHVLEQFLNEILEPEDGGGSRVTKSADYIKISCYTKLKAVTN